MGWPGPKFGEMFQLEICISGRNLLITCELTHLGQGVGTRGPVRAGMRSRGSPVQEEVRTEERSVTVHIFAKKRSLCALLQVLQDSLCGSSKVMLVCNLSPEAASASETLSSLNFAQRAAQVSLFIKESWPVLPLLLNDQKPGRGKVLAGR